MGSPLQSSPPRSLSSHLPVGQGHPLRAQPSPVGGVSSLWPLGGHRDQRRGQAAPESRALVSQAEMQGHTDSGQLCGEGAHSEWALGWGGDSRLLHLPQPGPPLHLDPTFCMGSGPAVSQEGRLRSKDLGWGTEGPIGECPHQGALEASPPQGLHSPTDILSGPEAAQRHYFDNKVPPSQRYGFSRSHGWM